MGLHSPFGYVNYEVPMAELFIDILDKLCAHCHTNDDYRRGCTNDDYRRGCRECPAGNLAFECRDYILNAEEEDKHYDLYTSDEWQNKRKEMYGKPDPPEEIEKWRKLADEHCAESNVLRAMKAKIKRITPHPFFYVRHHRKYPYERPKVLSDFAELTEKYKKLRNDRLRRWGLLKDGT